MATRTYSTTSGIVNLQSDYGVDWSKDKTLRDLGMSEQSAKDNFPAFTLYWQTMGWPTVELLDLYLFECAWNDALISGDRYFTSGIYVRPNGVSQSRVWIIAPCGKYRVRYGCMTALGRYTGGNPQLSSDPAGTMPGGTGIEIDHAGWSARNPNRICIWGTPWGKDYNQVGGVAYQEGVIVENFRLMGAKSKKTGTYFCTGLALNEPGENSGVWNMMLEDFPGAGMTIFNGTPFQADGISAFNNEGPGIDLWGSNGLANIRVGTSGDNNLALVRIRPRDSQSVGGGTIQITFSKNENRGSESGGRVQIPVLIEGAMGELNLVVQGLTADYKDSVCPYLIGGNWSGNQFEINASAIDLRSSVEALAYQGSTGKKLIGGKQFSGNSFIWNDEGLAFKSRQNMQLSTSGYTGTWQTGEWGPCINGSKSRTVTCVGGTCDPATKPDETQPCTITPPPSGTQISTAGWEVKASATNPGGREQPSYAIDADLATVWTSGIRQDASDQWIQFAAPAEQTFKAASFALPTAWSNDYARTAQVYVGSSATGGAAVSATITGTNPMVVTFASPVKGKYFRLTAKKTAGVSNWFTVGAATFTKP